MHCHHPFHYHHHHHHFHRYYRQCRWWKLIEMFKMRYSKEQSRCSTYFKRLNKTFLQYCTIIFPGVQYSFVAVFCRWWWKPVVALNLSWVFIVRYSFPLFRSFFLSPFIWLFFLRFSFSPTLSSPFLSLSLYLFCRLLFLRIFDKLAFKVQFEICWYSKFTLKII